LAFGEPAETIGVLVDILYSRPNNYITLNISGTETTEDLEIIKYIIDNGAKNERYPISAEIRGQICIYKDLTYVYNGFKNEFPVENFDTIDNKGDDPNIKPLFTLPSIEVYEIIKYLRLQKQKLKSLRSSTSYNDSKSDNKEIR